MTFCAGGLCDDVAPMPPAETPTDRERAEKRLRSAVNLLYLMALLKLFGLGATAQQSLAVAGWYAVACAVSIVLARLLPRRTLLVRNLAIAWAVLHLAGIALVMQIGVIAVINALLGLMLLGTIVVAAGFGAFDGESASA
jgi:hypothetical protein